MGRYGWVVTLALVIVITAAYAVAAILPDSARTEADCLSYQREVRAIPATGQNMDKMADYGCTYGPTDRWHVS